MKKWTSVFGKIIMCVCEIIVGVLLLLDPLSFTSSIIKVAGILLILNGVYSVFLYFKTNPVEAQKEQKLVQGLSYISCGLFCFFYTQWFITTFPLLTVIYGVTIFFTGLMRVQWAIDMLRIKTKQWYMALLGALIAFVLSGLILVNPFNDTVFLWRFVAISLIIGAVIDLIVLVFVNQNPKHDNTSEKISSDETDIEADKETDIDKMD